MDDREPLFPKLSRREKQISRLIHAGFTSYEIRSLLELDVQTVKNVVCTVNSKLGIHSRAEIARMVELNWKWFRFANPNAKGNQVKEGVAMRRLSNPPEEINPTQE